MSGSSSTRALRMAYVVAAVAGVLFFVTSVGLLGVWPTQILREQTSRMAPEAPLRPSVSESRGRLVYAREGCSYCHSQQVRFTAADARRFGAPTLAWETQFDTPHMLGTRRIGPDLSRTGGTRSLDWQYAHLYAPRDLVRESVMPAYPWLFDGAPDRPTQEARDLVAYLDSLGRAREVAGPEGEARAREGCDCDDDPMMAMAFEGRLNNHPARAIRHGDAPTLPIDTEALPRGQALYARHCATCHGPEGQGNGPGARGLRPAPKNLSQHEYSSARLASALWNGVTGAAMPAWRDLSTDDLGALAQAVQALSVTRVEPAPSEALLAQGREVYAANCAQCHGPDGRGNGTAADALPMVPANFTQQQLSLSEAVRVLREGIPGSPMAPWTSRLTSADILATAHYVRSLYAPALPGHLRK